MSHLEDQQFDPQVKNLSKKKNQKTMSLLDYVSDPKREESLIGLQYVVEIKMLESEKSVVKCNLCNVKGQMATMREHLVGTNHVKVYMEKHYFSVLQSLKRSSHHKAQLAKLLKDYAKEIERAEGTQSIKIEYVSAADMKKEQENWMAEQEERLEFRVEQKKFQVLDRRQMALNYSEKFKISSREEATIVLNLTQQLSDQLEQYFLKYKGLHNYPQDGHENLPPKTTANQGSNKEMQWHTEGLSTSVCTPPSVALFDSMPAKLGDTRGVKRKPEVSEDSSHKCDIFSESRTASDFQSREKRPHKEFNYCSTMHSSSFSCINDTRSPTPSSVDLSSSRSSSNTATYTHINIPKDSSCGGEMSFKKHTPQDRVSQNNLNNLSETEAVLEKESVNDTDTAETSDVGTERNTAVPGPSSSSSNCPYEPNFERPSSSHLQGKTSKTLSPDILQLLKGKDAHTVMNILRTLSPFYPALQEVNLEILAQVLVNTGALD
ncbi:uncharacterized protein RB166_006793 isoform 2-T2 [Leptodactylus fuscus]|uniref:uncharacterized protein LOC142200573 isoform X2 n=1 Tax=Leptodactylus fuscus TaxID=238119 RepID=UPI003F4E828A